MKQVGGAFKIDMAFNLSIILPHLAVGTAWLNLFIHSSQQQRHTLLSVQLG
jgi:hypothetical protein